MVINQSLTNFNAARKSSTTLSHISLGLYQSGTNSNALGLSSTTISRIS